MDAWRSGDSFVVAFDLPGVDPDAIELDVERNVLTVKAERRPAVAAEDVEMQVAERPLGVFSRQLFLGDTLDADRIEAHYRPGCSPCASPSPRRRSRARSPSRPRTAAAGRSTHDVRAGPGGARTAGPGRA
jgi:putative ubiquitin-RnfH superfamily antitoxin RatB of RatAB toxin-antitoxin module